MDISNGTNGFLFVCFLLLTSLPAYIKDLTWLRNNQSKINSVSVDINAKLLKVMTKTMYSLGVHIGSVQGVILQVLEIYQSIVIKVNLSVRKTLSIQVYNPAKISIPLAKLLSY